MKKLLLESCVENFSGAKYAQEKGADRIELCDNLAVGGTTPSLATIEFVQSRLSIPQAVIIRARGGDFEYTEIEKEIMLRDIDLCNQLGVPGIVVGALKGKRYDRDFMSQARNLATKSQIISHMAFDETVDLKDSLDLLIELGYDRVLTKGGRGSASENINVLTDLIAYANGRITILVGGGVTKDNVQYIAENTGATELHGKLIV
ncbi:MAG: copper homeostasis protein CutC [Brevinema sp.]